MFLFIFYFLVSNKSVFFSQNNRLYLSLDSDLQINLRFIFLFIFIFIAKIYMYKNDCIQQIFEFTLSLILYIVLLYCIQLHVQYRAN